MSAAFTQLASRGRPTTSCSTCATTAAVLSSTSPARSATWWQASTRTAEQDLRAPAVQRQAHGRHQRPGQQHAVLQRGQRHRQHRHHGERTAADAEPEPCLCAGQPRHLLGQRGHRQRPARHRCRSGARWRHHLRQALRFHRQGQLRHLVLPDRVRRASTTKASATTPTASGRPPPAPWPTTSPKRSATAAKACSPRR